MLDDLAADDHGEKLQDGHAQGAGENTGEVEYGQGENSKNKESGRGKASGHFVEKGIESSFAIDEITTGFAGKVARQFSQPAAEAGNYAEENRVQVGAQGENEGQPRGGQEITVALPMRLIMKLLKYPHWLKRCTSSLCVPSQNAPKTIARIPII